MNYYLGRRRSTSRASADNQASRSMSKQAYDAQQNYIRNTRASAQAANDNYKSPSNDNYKGTTAKNMQRIVRVGTLLFRVSPHYRIARIGWEIFQQLMRLMPEGWAFNWTSSGWRILRICPLPRGGFGFYQGLGTSYPASPLCFRSTGTGAFPAYPGPVLPQHKFIHAYSRYEQAAPFRGDSMIQFARDQTGSVSIPHWQWEFIEPNPWNDPKQLPVNRPAPWSRPSPWITIPDRRPDPWRPPPAKDADKKPEVEPGRGRDREVTYEPGRSVSVNTRPGTRRKPGSGEKEKKFEGNEAAQRWLRSIARGKEWASEIDDFIDSIRDALPKSVKDKTKGRKTPQSKLKEIYDNWDDIDWKKAVENIIENHLEDAIVGRALKQSDKASRRRGESSNISGRAWINAGGRF